MSDFLELLYLDWVWAWVSSLLVVAVSFRKLLINEG